MSATATPPAPTGPAMSLGARVINTFIAPSQAFAEIRRSAAWWLPWVLLLLGTIAFVSGVQTKVGFDQVYQNNLHNSPKGQARLEQATPEQRAQGMRIGTMITKYVAYGFPVLRLVGWIILAAILMATFNFGMGAELSFGTCLGVTAWGTLPEIFRSLLAAALLFSGKVDPEGFNLQNPVGTNLGYYLDPAGSKFLFTLGSGLDVFIIWSLIITGIGYASVSKVKKGAAIGVVVGWYLVFLLIGAAFSLLG
ncbi:MAG TPA: YIP1 family protein [Terriglobales bacterium]|nr:YIP1 family protein [Terriglobales bacterium]